MAILDVIKFEGGNHQLVWKHPAQDFNTHSVLIVNEGQLALFYRNGQIADTFGPGRYVLETKNIPLLRKLLELPTGGVSTFSCQVYFVNLVEAMDIKWGLPSKASWLDPVYGIRISIGARGNLSIAVNDPTHLVVGLVGAEAALTAEGLTTYFRDLITMRTKAYLAQIVRDQQLSVFDLDSNLELISDELRKKIGKDFLEYGIKLRMFNIAEFVLPVDDPQYIRLERAIAERTTGITEAQTARQQATIAAHASAESELIRSQGHAAALNALGTNYVTDRQLDIAENMSKNESMNQFSGMAGSMAMTGAALNMGVQAAGNIAGAFGNMNPMAQQNPYMMQQNLYQPQQQAPQQPAPQPAQPAQSGTKICIHCGKELPADAGFCMYCGTPQPKTCPTCGAVISEGAAFCMKCGTKL